MQSVVKRKARFSNLLGESVETSHQIMIRGNRFYLPIDAAIGISDFHKINPGILSGYQWYGSPLRLALKANGYKIKWLSIFGFQDAIQILATKGDKRDNRGD